MSDNVSADDSKYRVAYDLMHKISAYEKDTKDRKYWLTLYAQCVHASHMKDIDNLLQIGK